jgi:hypothetical protein
MGVWAEGLKKTRERGNSFKFSKSTQKTAETIGNKGAQSLKKV